LKYCLRIKNKGNNFNKQLINYIIDINNKLRRVSNILSIIYNLILTNFIIAYITFFIAVSLSKRNTRNPWEIMDEIEQSLKQINNEKVSNFIYNIINASMNNPMIGYAFVFGICCIPILNIIILISYLKEIINNKNN
jgi:uncharacterized protein YjgD (DUF1641 family)